MNRAFGHLRGNAVAYAALFIALGGTAFAAANAIPANSVGTAQIKNGAVTGQKVAHATLTGGNIKSSTLGTVPNSAKLGGSSPAAFQRRISAACASGNAIRAVAANGGPTCQAFGQGTITSVVAGTGLLGGATSGQATLNVDPMSVQSLVTGSCASGKAMKSIDPMGQVTCGGTMAPVMGGSGTAIVNNGAYLAPDGVSAPQANLTDAQMVSPAVPMTVSNLSVSVGNAPTANGSWLAALVVNGSSVGAPQCTISGNDTTCTDTAYSIVVPAGATLAFHLSPTSGMPNTTTVSFAYTAQT